MTIPNLPQIRFIAISSVGNRKFILPIALLVILVIISHITSATSHGVNGSIASIKDLCIREIVTRVVFFNACQNLTGRDC